MSAVGTLVGDLVTEDPDIDQTFIYTLTDNAGGRFVLHGNQVKVNKTIKDPNYWPILRASYFSVHISTELNFSKNYY
jgi:hypothetical protein